VTERPIRRGSIAFSIESRVLRELGERLVRQPEVALIELVKNAYDADAESCTIEVSKNAVTVTDTGTGMTFASFTDAWMRIGTSSKERTVKSTLYGRQITGEKGIGRFAVRFLGRRLTLDSVAYDEGRKLKTRLSASFDWEAFDQGEDIGNVLVPYKLTRVDENIPTGTTLSINNLRFDVLNNLNWKKIRTGSIGVVSGIRSLLQTRTQTDEDADPGFRLVTSDQGENFDTAKAILKHFVFRAKIRADDKRLIIRVYKNGEKGSFISINDAYEHEVGFLKADIRFFPRRPGTFSGAPVDGRAAYTWVRENSGVKVFDRGFQLQPYGEAGDDWLSLVRDAARNERHPQSQVTRTHFPMTKEVQASTKLNWAQIDVFGVFMQIFSDHLVGETEDKMVREAFMRLKGVMGRFKGDLNFAARLEKAVETLSHPLIFQAWCVCPASTLSSCQSLPC